VQPGETVAAEVIAPTGKRDTATGTAGRADESKTVATIGTEKRWPGRIQPPLATEALRRKQQIFHCLKKGRHPLCPELVVTY
jgi:hypothetical protein